jgi:hypothetical protein
MIQFSENMIFVKRIQYREETRMLTRIDSETVLNLDAVAAVRFLRDENDLTAKVSFLVSASDGISETLVGDSAQKLYDLLGGNSEGPLTSPSVSALSPSGSSGGNTEPPISFVPFQPVFSRTKAWFYSKGPSGKGYFIAFINAKGSCSMRTFDAVTGRFIGKKYSPGNYQDQFAEFIRHSIELSINSQPNLERDCRERLPEGVLSYLKAQVSTL